MHETPDRTPVKVEETPRPGSARAAEQMQKSSSFRRIPSNIEFSPLDARILELWDRVDAFRRSVEQRPLESEYTFYDGPPFATGSPHYGHILAGIIKDIVPRYWTMRGHRIERRFGWDTHGLPVEMEVEKQLGVSGPRQILDIGVDTFNEACRSMVQTTTEDWEIVTSRIGRWVDFRDDYKTMDVDFMETVWWVFRQLWDRDLVYQDFKVLPYSFGATTPLSNFEANMDYRDVEDPAITVRLPVTADHGPAQAGDYLLVWTTTPWTLPGNLSVAVGDDIEYARVFGEINAHPGAYWVAADLVDQVFASDETRRVAAVVPGSDLLGVEYLPPFDHFGGQRDRGAFRVIPSDDVNTEEGTGLVHMAPAYGEADFLAMQSAGIDVLIDPVDAEGRFTDEVPEVAGVNVKDADSTLIAMLKQRGLIVRHGQIRHSYPFCWRTETPLIYKAIPTWFVKVEQMRNRMVELNESVHWVPEFVGSKRFGNWLEGARDWAISRNRYWGSCIPVWKCDSCREQRCIGSRAELHELSGVMLDDRHKHVVDEVTFPCAGCEGTMRRVPEVLDCWFESGSMPYAQSHYPFENQERFDRTFPANFIAEGLDQTRGWFYTLLVLSVALFDTAPFRNCIVNGMLLAEDGRKMSKSLKNYPDPTHILDAYGADGLRAYLINSPALRAEPLRFSETGVRHVVRTVLLPLWNAYSFFTTYAEADGITIDDIRSAPRPAERAEIDRWILSVLQSLIQQINREMEGYRLYNVVPPMLGFIDDLTNWYVRRSRRRFWSKRQEGSEQDKLAAFATLYEVLVTFSLVAAPVLPFITEELFQGLVVATGAAPTDQSVHLQDYPEADPAMIDNDLERQMGVVRSVVNLGRGLRKRADRRVRQPLAAMTVVTRDPERTAAVASHRELIAEELNVKEVLLSTHESAIVHLSAKANFKVLGPRLGADVKRVAALLEDLDHEDVDALAEGASRRVGGVDLTVDDVVLHREPRAGLVVATEGPLSVALDVELTDGLLVEGIAREIVNRIQSLRRDAGFDVTDRINVGWVSDDASIAAAFEAHGGFIADEVLAASIRAAGRAEIDVDIEGRRVRLDVTAAN